MQQKRFVVLYAGLIQSGVGFELDFLDPSLGFLGFFGFHLIAFPSARKPQNFFIIFVHLESPVFEWELQTFTAGFKFEGPLTNASGGYKLHG